MPTDAFNAWADRFDRRYRFGIPSTPTERRANVPPSIVALPERANSMKFSPDDVTAVIELLAKCEPGQAVKLTDDPDGKENTSRRRAEIIKEQIEQRMNGEAIKPGFKLRGHVLTAGEPEVKKISGKNYKFFPENWGAVSLVPDTDTEATEAPDTPPENPNPDAGQDNPAAPDNPPADPEPAKRNRR